MRKLELLPGEQLLVSKNANTVLGTVKIANNTMPNAVGGKLYLTDLRLVFLVGRINSLQGLQGGFAIPLSLITQVRDASSGLRRQIEVASHLGRLTFGVWGVAKLIDRIEAARSAVTVESEMPLCHECGEPLDPGDPWFNPPWPDAVADMTEEGRDEHVRFDSHSMVETDNLGDFVRALLPVPLADGRTFTIGVWISVEADVYAYVDKFGRGKPDHSQLHFEGRLANSIEPWGERILGAPISAGLPAGADNLEMPHVLGSPAPEISAILNDRWRAEDVLTGDMRWALNYDPAAPPPPHRH